MKSLLSCCVTCEGTPRWIEIDHASFFRVGAGSAANCAGKASPVRVLVGDSHLIHELVLKVDALQPHSVLLAAGLVSLGYAGMLLVEDIGLWLELTWAAYLTVLSTSLLLPFEQYEVIEQLSMLRVGVLLLNLVIVLYLVSPLERHTSRSRAQLPRQDSVV